MIDNNFDVLVIGAGHAGIEACLAAARMGMKTALLTMSLENMGKPSCNPSIGGSAKGHLVKEIDALGGEMGFLADKGGIEFKMLNKSKGPAIWSPRCQIDKDLYPKYVKQTLLSQNNLTLIKATAEEVLVENDKVVGIKTQTNEIIKTKALILCAGTFLNGVMHTGQEKTIGGRIGEPAANKISDLLASYGLEKGRLKTGTPPRISKQSINYKVLEIADHDENPLPFSFRSDRVKNRIVCHQSETSETTHDILREGFDRSPMFTGKISGAGPRYCPSIEDKIFRFAERNSHKILLEPEGLNTNSIYVNGFSTSLPEDIQDRGIKSIRGLENAVITKKGYAVEYDFFFPYQLQFTLETKAIEGLYFAGQINGTSGYEEAAAQGLVAGINAAAKIKEQEPLILKRSEAYIGVLIDDLVNKSTEEPYRIFTSLAEYRLLLRQDNADERLMKYGNRYGLIEDRTLENVNKRIRKVENTIEKIKTTKPDLNETNIYLQSIEESLLDRKADIFNLTKRGKTELKDLISLESIKSIFSDILDKELIIDKVQLEVKYEGYIQRQMKEIKYFMENEEKMIPKNFDFNKVTSLSREAREKLNKIRPGSIGQASRISGVSAADVSVLTLFLRG